MVSGEAVSERVHHCPGLTGCLVWGPSTVASSPACAWSYSPPFLPSYGQGKSLVKSSRDYGWEEHGWTELTLPHPCSYLWPAWFCTGKTFHLYLSEETSETTSVIKGLTCGQIYLYGLYFLERSIDLLRHFCCHSVVVLHQNRLEGFQI